MSQLPVPQQPATDALIIAPENLEIANCYLQFQDVKEVAENMGITPHEVSQILSRREVQAYIDAVFMDIGFNNRFKMRRALDAVIAQKFQDMEEAGTGSTKDISDLLMISHKMAMEHMDKQIQLEKLRQQQETNIRSQVNVQINDAGGSNYGALLTKLLASE